MFHGYLYNCVRLTNHIEPTDRFRGNFSDVPSCSCSGGGSCLKLFVAQRFQIQIEQACISLEVEARQRCHRGRRS